MIQQPLPDQPVEPLASDEVHIASFVVHADPSSLDHVKTVLTSLAGVEIHATDPSGKLVIVAEADSDFGITDCLDVVRLTDGVHCASLVYHQVEERTALDQELSA